MADDLAVFVGHPAEDPGVGPDIGCGDIAFGPDDVRKRAHIGAGQAFELAFAQGVGIDAHAALAAAIGQARDGALDGHPEGEALDLVLGHRGVEPDPALGGAKGVLEPATPGLEAPLGAVVHVDHQPRLQRFPGELEDLKRVRIGLKAGRSLFEAGEGGLEEVRTHAGE